VKVLRLKRINDLIKRRGVLCYVEHPSSSTPVSDYAVIILAGGRRPRDPKEYLRYGEVKGDSPFEIGHVICNNVSNEKFLIVNKEPQYHSGEVVWQRLQIFQCNVLADIYTKEETSGGAGGSKISFSLLEQGIPCCLYSFEFTDKQRKHGLESFLKRRLYFSSENMVNVDDMIIINNDKYRVSYLDKDSFPGVYSCLLQDEERE
jgi:hypothetical protein